MCTGRQKGIATEQKTESFAHQSTKHSCVRVLGKLSLDSEMLSRTWLRYTNCTIVRSKPSTQNTNEVSGTHVATTLSCTDKTNFCKDRVEYSADSEKTQKLHHLFRVSSFCEKLTQKSVLSTDFLWTAIASHLAAKPRQVLNSFDDEATSDLDFSSCLQLSKGASVFPLHRRDTSLSFKIIPLTQTSWAKPRTAVNKLVKSCLNRSFSVALSSLHARRENRTRPKRKQRFHLVDVWCGTTPTPVIRMSE